METPASQIPLLLLQPRQGEWRIEISRQCEYEVANEGSSRLKSSQNSAERHVMALIGSARVIPHASGKRYSRAAGTHEIRQGELRRQDLYVYLGIMLNKSSLT